MESAARKIITAPPKKPTFPRSSERVMMAPWLCGRWRARSSLLLLRSDLVVAQCPKEDFLVHGLPGVVEHRRDAERTAELGALPGDDDQRLGRFLIAQNGHAQIPAFLGLSLLLLLSFLLGLWLHRR